MVLKNSLSALALSFLFACTGAHTMQRANTLGAGKMQLTVDGNYSSISDTSSSSSSNNSGFAALEVAGRYGAMDKLDVGAQLNVITSTSSNSGDGKIIGGSIFGKYQLLSDPSYALSIAPTLGYNLISSSDSGSQSQNYSMISIPVLFGYNIGKHQVVLGLKGIRYGTSLDLGLSQTIDLSTINVGASIGFAFALSDSIQIMPELAILKAVSSSTNTSGSNSFQTQLDNAGALTSFGVGVLFGGQ